MSFQAMTKKVRYAWHGADFIFDEVGDDTEVDISFDNEAIEKLIDRRAEPKGPLVFRARPNK